MGELMHNHHAPLSYASTALSLQLSLSDPIVEQATSDEQQAFTRASVTEPASHSELGETLYFNPQDFNLQQTDFLPLVELMSNHELDEHSMHANSINNVAQISQEVSNKKRHNLSDEEVTNVVNDLLLHVSGTSLATGAIKKVAQLHNSNRWTVGRIWKKVKECLQRKVKVRVRNNRKGKCGRKGYTIDDQALSNIPLRNRTTIMNLAAALKVSKSTIHKYVKWGKIRRHTNPLKPGLTKKNLIQRLKWCLSQVENMNSNPVFKDGYNTVHVDEKLFFLSQKSARFYLASSEEAPYRTVKNKNYICRVMFLVAVARPRFNDDGVCTFDGKIGCFPLVDMVPAQRKSANRPRGTIECKPIQKVTRNVIRSKFINELLPAIKAKWPLEDEGTIYIQQDNAPAHMKVEDEDFRKVAQSDGFNINLVQQPPNSPDLNVLDLGFFRAIQAIQYKKMPKDAMSLINEVQKAYNNYDPVKVNHIFLTQQLCMLETMKKEGSNNYNLPHIGKLRLERQGMLPTSIKVPPQLLRDSMNSLLRQENTLMFNEECEEVEALLAGAQHVPMEESIHDTTTN